MRAIWERLLECDGVIVQTYRRLEVHAVSTLKFPGGLLERAQTIVTSRGHGRVKNKPKQRGMERPATAKGSRLAGGEPSDVVDQNVKGRRRAMVM